MSENIIKLWMPVSKDSSGTFNAILSDTSIDRDEELMGKELLTDWATNKSLPALVNHENKMDKWVGGWHNLRTVSKDENTALMASPWFFTKEANPLAPQIKKQVEESIEQGLNPGISISAIPKASIKKEINGKEYTVYTKAELVEATWVPVQSNRNATYGHIAKSFDLKDLDSNDNLKKILEDNKMSEEKTYTQKELDEKLSELRKELETPVETEEVKEEAVEESESEKSIKDATETIIKLKKEFEDFKSKSILKGTVEGPVSDKEIDEEVTIEKMISIGGLK